MEEVPAHVHPGPIVPDVLKRQHEHRSGHFFGYKVKKEPLEAWILRAFTGSETDDDLILRSRRFIFFTPWRSYASRFLREFGSSLGGARQIGEDGPASAVEVLSYPNDKYIRWYRGITRVYIGNPANRDTRSVEY
ncbi:hypothetical protein M9H77_31604 [Catharanthus roseus]|uniref:Uncharacterized protein n=1 Tax=Catharanthus roseus TaxID=4058 RepID=A0ACC0A0K8_CATRO|nr:hypothetical protein M9H77_31604 [Catharanthus roseus]